MRVQQTRSSPSALCEPLTRHPFGAWSQLPSPRFTFPAGLGLFMGPQP